MASDRPPVPPRPYDYAEYDYQHQYQPQQPERQNSIPPPIPPLPPNFNANDYDYNGGVAGSIGGGGPAYVGAGSGYVQNVQNGNYSGYRGGYEYESPPHLADPLVAPRPQRLTPDAPADVRSSFTSAFVLIVRDRLGFDSFGRAQCLLCPWC